MSKERIDKNKSIRYDDLPHFIKEFLFENHDHDENENIVYHEKDVLTLIANLLPTKEAKKIIQVKERAELRLDKDLKMRLMADSLKLGISLNEYCEMKLKKDYVTVIAMVGDPGEFIDGVKKLSK